MRESGAGLLEAKEAHDGEDMRCNKGRPLRNWVTTRPPPSPVKSTSSSLRGGLCGASQTAEASVALLPFAERCSTSAMPCICLTRHIVLRTGTDKTASVPRATPAALDVQLGQGAD